MWSLYTCILYLKFACRDKYRLVNARVRAGTAHQQCLATNLETPVYRKNLWCKVSLEDSGWWGRARHWIRKSRLTRTPKWTPYTALRPLHPDVRNHPRADDLTVPLALVYRTTRVYHYRPLHSWYLRFIAHLQPGEKQWAHCRASERIEERDARV